MDKGWIERAWRHAQKMLTSKNPQDQIFIEDLKRFPDDTYHIVSSFAAWHSMRGGDGDDAAWRTAESKKRGVGERAVVSRRSLGLMQLGFEEHYDQREVNKHREAVAKIQRQIGLEKEKEEAALLLPKAVAITRMLTSAREQLQEYIQTEENISAAARPLLRSLSAMLEAIEQGRENRVYEQCAFLIRGVQHLALNSEQASEKVAHSEQAAMEALMEIDALQERIKELKQQLADAGSGIMLAEVSAENHGARGVDDASTVADASVRLSEFRKFLESKHAILSQSLDGVLHSQEKVDTFKAELQNQKEAVDAAHKETQRLGKMFAAGAVSMPEAELQNLFIQLQEARRAQQDAEVAEEAVKTELSELQKRASDAGYMRRLQQAKMNLSLTVHAVRTTEEIMDSLAWEGKFGDWEAGHQEHIEAVAVTPDSRDDDDETAAVIGSGFLAERREILEQIPFYRLYPEKALERLLSRGDEDRRRNVEHLFENGIHASFVLSTIFVHPTLWKQIVEREICKHREPQGVYRFPQTIEDGLREREILDASDVLSWEHLAAWMHQQVSA